MQVGIIASKGGFFVCPYCITKTNIPYFGNQEFKTATDLHNSLNTYNSNPRDINVDSRIIGGCTIVGGYGFKFSINLPIVLIISDFGLRVHPLAEKESIFISTKNIKEVDINGPGATTSGGGFFGGGFGLTGIIEGVLISSVLNKLTTRTDITTNISISTSSEKYIFLNKHMLPEQMITSFSPILDKLEEKTSEISEKNADRLDLADQLSRITELYRDGNLSEEEFTKAKQKVLGK